MAPTAFIAGRRALLKHLHEMQLAAQEHDANARRAGDMPDSVLWSERVSGKILDPWQVRFLRAPEPELLMVTTRQGGKTEVVSLRAAFRARFLRREVGCLGPTLRQTARMFSRAKSWLRADGAVLASDKGLELAIRKGGSIVAYPGDRPDVSIRGDTLDDVIIDEAAIIKDGLIAAATPTMATRPDRSIVMLSTPMGRRGAMWEAWSSQPWWSKVIATWRECPRIDPAFLARERIRLGVLFPQEYEGQFLAGVGSIFEHGVFENMFQSPGIPGMVEPLTEESAIW